VTTDTSGPRVIVAPPGLLLPHAVDCIVASERSRLPDLGGITVIVPALNAIPDVARALQKAACADVVLLPRIATLQQLAGDIPLEHRVLGRAERESVLYRVLSERKWLSKADLWTIAAELCDLFDELTRYSVVLPATEQAFRAQVLEAYRAKRGASLEFEARLVHDLWCAATGDTDPQAAYQLRLARWAGQPRGPMYLLHQVPLTTAEQQFLAKYHEKAAVTVITTGDDATDGYTRLLCAAWPGDAGMHLQDRAKVLLEATVATGAAVSPAASRMRLFGASSPEEEAEAVDVTVREWLLEGRSRIAVVAYDRAVARRARALLERAQVFVADEIGWPLSTTSAATVIQRWLDAVAQRFYHQDLLDFLKSPFAFHHWSRDERQSAVWRLEQYIRKSSVAAGLENYMALAERETDQRVLDMLKAVQEAREKLGRQRRPLARWLDALIGSIDEIGVREGLAADAAGIQVLSLLEDLRMSLADDPLTVPDAEWRRWLLRQLEAAPFRDRSIASPVIFTNLGAASLRQFDGLIVLGCDARQLPGPATTAMFFNDRVRGQLGLPVQARFVRDTERGLIDLITRADATLITWQRSVDAEPNPLSPLFQRLQAIHVMAYKAPLGDGGLSTRIPGSGVAIEEPPVLAASRMPTPAVPSDLVPTAISASGYRSLVGCPYQYYVQYALHLGEADEVQETMEKADYGTLIHDVLARFHREHPVVSDLERGAAIAFLRQYSDEAFAADISRNYLARDWLLRWCGLLADYVDWQCAREAEGWRFYEAEATKKRQYTTPGGRALTLRGRIDRVDRQSDGSFALIDYKTQAEKGLKEKVKPEGEDVQLAVYAMLSDGPVSDARFLSLDKDGVKAVALDPATMDEHTQAQEDRLLLLIDALHEGTPAPAGGHDVTCEWCSVRGICRKAHWEEGLQPAARDEP
jgi:ATP-dependent helicase/nuclease subunit B